MPNFMSNLGHPIVTIPQIHNIDDSSLDILLNDSISSIEITQNSSLFLTLTLINTTSSETVEVNANPTFWLVDTEGLSTISTQIFLQFENIGSGQWNVSRNNFLDIQPRETTFEIKIDVNGTEITKHVPLVIIPFDLQPPKISLVGLSENEIVSPRHILNFEIIEDIRLIAIEILKNGDVYFAIDMDGPPISEENNTRYFVNSTYFRSHGLELGSSSSSPTNLTIRAMDYSRIWISKSINIIIDSEGPVIEFIGLNLITTEYLSVPHLEIRENDPFVLHWFAEDQFSNPDHYDIEIDGEYLDTVHENQVDLTDALKARYYAYSILVTPYDALGNRGSSIEVSVLVLTENGEILRDDLGQSSASSKTNRNWGLVVGFLIIAYLMLRILFGTKAGRSFLKKSYKPFNWSRDLKK